jgi:UDP-N-acetylglucosamine transferase subunit ALG13
MLHNYNILHNTCRPRAMKNKQQNKQNKNQQNHQQQIAKILSLMEYAISLTSSSTCWSGTQSSTLNGSKCPVISLGYSSVQHFKAASKRFTTAVVW